jgi:rhodanese-related sulfurtransferase
MKASELKELIAKGEAPVMFDVREGGDQGAQGETFEGAARTRAGRLYVMATKDQLPKDKKIMLISGAGDEGPEAAQILRDNGYDVECLETEGAAAPDEAAEGPGEAVAEEGSEGDGGTTP